MSAQMTILPNGLRVITDEVKTVESVALGVWAGAGARYEDLPQNGIAHMVEHMMFKGTHTRSAVQIASQIEDVGGDINAYTGREETAYHIKLLKDDVPLAVNILADIIQNPTMPDEEIERERHVILQEIGMTADTPDDLIFDEYQETAYPGQALGTPILGRRRIIETMSRDVLMSYVQKFYTPARLVISAAGNIKHEDFVEMVQGAFDHLPANQNYDIAPALYQGGECRLEKDLEQSHLTLGFRGVSRGDDRFYSVMALSVLMGGGMASRLFQEIREKRGLVYSIFSMHDPYQDDGQFIVYAGTGPDDLRELVPVLCEELGRVRSVQVSEEELSRAKAQLRSHLLMGRESMLTRATQQARSLIYFDEVLDIEKRLAAIEAVNIRDIQQAARDIFKTKPTVAALGPLSALESYDGIVGRLVG